MKSVRVAIVGAGLSGLVAAYRLAQQGMHDYVVIEAKALPGGRILSFDVVQGEASANRFDLGPTWFWPDYQPQLAELVNALELPAFAQYESGDTWVEQAGMPPQRKRGYPNVPASMRLLGGMNTLTDALLRRINPETIHVGLNVKRLASNTDGIILEVEEAMGDRAVFQAQHVLLAVPPRIAASRIEFVPALPPALVSAWKHTPTWMAPHAKYIAVYDTPFWREQGLSGEARSGRGPLVEIHDASQPEGMAALFGFIGVPANARAALADDVMLKACRAQLVRLFGERAANPVAETIKDWSSDALVATADDINGFGAHVTAPASAPSSGPWQGRITGIASEWSPQFPGYVAGAVQAASLAVR